MFHKLDKYARDDNATKAIFEHFRNVAVACAVYAAAVWLQKKADFHSFNGLASFAGAAVLGFVAFGLFWIAMTNAAQRLRQATGGGFFVHIGWALYCATGLIGLISYAIR